MSDTNAKNLSASNTESDVHTYTIDWQPDYTTWAVDGNIQRTLLRNETYNQTTGQYHYPQTPSRIMLSLWPAGLASNGQGTIDWAGGQISWNSPYMQNGYYYAMFKDVTVECYNPPSGYQNHGSKAYYYTTTAGTNDTVAIGNNNTVIASFQATGDKPNYDPNASQSASGTKTASSSSSATADSNPESIPGVSGAGSRGDTAGANSNDESSASGSAAAAGATQSSNTYGSNSFSQGNTNSQSDGARVVAGSLVALVAFLAAAMML